VITGGSGGPKLVSRNSFGFSEIFIDVDAITGMPWVSAKSRFPIGCRILQREGIIETDDAFEKRIETKSQLDTVNTMPHKPTKQEWKAKLGANNRGFAVAGQLLISKTELVQLRGQPDRTETIGSDAYWYYDCNDGTIQIVFPAVVADRTGSIVGKVNDF
jgi:hypothetical protein